MGKHVRIPDLVLQNRLPDLLSDADLAALIPGTPDQRHSRIKRALARGDLVSLRRGLYVLGEVYRREPVRVRALAQRIYGPSYLSFESALSYWGLIPEAVHVVSSGCSARSKIFDTPLGRFEYVRIPATPLLTGVVREAGEGQPFLVARPLRALADYVYRSKTTWTLEALADSLRLELDFPLDSREHQELMKAYSDSKVRTFLASCPAHFEKMRESA